MAYKEVECCGGDQIKIRKTFINKVIQISIMINIFTLVRSDDASSIPPKHNLTSVSRRDLPISTSLITNSSLTSVVSATSDINFSSKVSSNIILSSTSTIATPENTTSMAHDIGASVTSFVSSSDSAFSLYTIHQSSNYSIMASTVVSEHINNTISPSPSTSGTSNTSTAETPITMSASSHLSPSFVTSISNNSTSVNISSSTVLSNATSRIVFPTATLNSTVVPLTSTTGFFNVSTFVVSPVTTMHQAVTNISSSFVVENSTTVCPTTTVYINCSSAYILRNSSTPTIVNSTSVIANITSSTVNITSSFVNVTASVAAANATSVYIASTVASMMTNNTSTRYHTSKLTSIPVGVSTIVFTNSSIPIQYSTYTINVTASSSIVYTSAQIILPALTKCDVYLSRFTDAYTELSKCILNNMHPMRVCSNCSIAYTTFSKNHKNIFKDCGVTLIYDYNMQYQVIPKMYAAQETTWKSLECDKCYVRDDQGVSEYSPDFKAYIDLYNQVNACFENHTHDSWMHLPNDTVKNTTYDKQICSDCRHLYHQMQLKYEYYGDAGEDSPTKWCSDINVAVNETRHKWSVDFKCGTKEKDLESVIALTTFFCFLPIVFYVGAKLHADVRERKSANRFNYDSE